MASRRYRGPYCNFSLACNLAALNGRDRGNGNDTRGQQGIFHERVKQSGLSSFELTYACNVETPFQRALGEALGFCFGSFRTKFIRQDG
jgi:hypothetical protein